MSYQLKFDVGFATGNQRICLRKKDKIGPQILKLAENGGTNSVESIPIFVVTCLLYFKLSQLSRLRQNLIWF